MRKPVARADMKAAVMSEHNDRSGRIFKQVLAAANVKLKELAGLELVAEAASGAPMDEEGDAGASQAQSQAVGSSQAPPGASRPSVKSTSSYLLVNRLAEPVRTEPDDATSVYHAFIEVVLSFLQQSEGGTLDEEKLFGYLAQIGLERKAGLPVAAELDKVESLVQRRLVAEAWIRRQKKPNDPDQFQYVAGSRAKLNRNEAKADAFREWVLSDEGGRGRMD